MIPKKIENKQHNLFFQKLSEWLDPRNELIVLSRAIPWSYYEEEFGKQFSLGPGQPPKAIRLIVGLLMLQHIKGLSDEAVVRHWVENPYWQYFCGYEELQWDLPIDPTSLSRWRKRLGKEGMEKILSSTVSVASIKNVISKNDLKNVIVDTTVQEANVRYPTDSSLLNECREKLVNLCKEHGVLLRQSYARIGKLQLQKAQGYAHAKQYKRLNKANKSLKTLFGRVSRDIERKLSNSPKKQVVFKQYLEYSKRLINQNKKSKDKLYSLHSPHVYCVAKGKSRTPYEYGHKVSLVLTHKQGLVLSAQTLDKPSYDGHTLGSALFNASTISGVKQKKVFVDKGKIMQDGCHRELIKQDGLYKTLWQNQSNGFFPSNNKEEVI